MSNVVLASCTITARDEIVKNGLEALRNVWIDTGANEDGIEPAMLARFATGKICRPPPRDAGIDAAA